MKVTLSSFNVGDLKMIVVYLRGSEWCGSGGCGMLVLEESGSFYKVIGDEAVVQLPIRLGDHTSHGMPDLIVHVQGGGLIKGYDAELSFNGRSYPDNPTVSPARKLSKPSSARVLIRQCDPAEPLY